MKEMPKNKALDWGKKCKDSNGQMVLLPNELIKEANEMEEMRLAVEEKAKEFNKMNLELEHVGQNFWYKVRKALDELGVEGSLEMNLGWNKEAKDDGVKVINLTRPTPKMQM